MILHIPTFELELICFLRFNHVNFSFLAFLPFFVCVHIFGIFSCIDMDENFKMVLIKMLPAFSTVWGYDGQINALPWVEFTDIRGQ